MNRLNGMIVIFSLCCVFTTARANIRLPNIISDNMVLQRSATANIWGWADPGEHVTVKGSWMDSPCLVTADTNGQWIAKIKTTSAGGPYTLHIYGKNSIFLENILIGEIWVCSGQSNMVMSVAEANNAQIEISAADYPHMRLFTVAKDIADKPQNDCIGYWSPCSSETVRQFSAVGYFFGRALHKKLGVPIGLINASFDGTQAEAWTCRDALESLGIYREHLKNDLPATVNLYKKQLREFEENTHRCDAGDRGFEKGYANLDFNDANWAQMTIPGFYTERPEMQILGVVWFRMAIDIPPSWVEQDLRLSLGIIDDYDITYFNGVKVGQTGNENHIAYATPRYYTIPASLVHIGQNVLAIRNFNNYHEGGLGGPTHLLKLSPGRKSNPQFISLAGLWKYKIEKELINTISTGKPTPDRNAFGTLYNAMIAPLTKFNIRGVVWYQGEGNGGLGYEYRRLFPALISCWRNKWQEGDFPFYYVQLASYKEAREIPPFWAWTREAQLMTLSTPNTGMAVITDISEPNNIHPRNKQDVGRRLALWALARTYGQNGIVFSVPLYKSMKVENNSIRIFFDYVGSGLICRGKQLTDFLIAGGDKQFYPAHAIIDGNTVIVSCDKISQPVAVRFGWENAPASNLFNNDGLPASPFRTDDWR